MRKSPQDTRPERRALQIFAFDPMKARAGENRITIETPYRELAVEKCRFYDDRLEVIDYDAAARCAYTAVNLDDPRVAMQQGLEPSEADPQFHQQMVYAVASRVLENFDRGLGRRLRFRGGRRLRLFPHAFSVRNAFYDQRLVAVLFGSFAADPDDPGANLPGQTIFTCLSHDIIAHEVTHAALDRLHEFFRVPTNPHVPALHEAFSDIVALFQRFTFPEVVREVIRQTRGDVSRPNPLLEIGAQFGAAAGLGSALRSAGGTPDPLAFARTTEPHALGRILLAAVYEGFLRTYERRIADLLRIATGGSGRLPEGELHPDLVNRLAAEATRTAQAVLLMCIRATDYLPPVDPSFSDFLRAMVTADYELNRSDESGLRAAMIEAFRVHGIRPEAVGSLAVESLLLEPEDPRAAPNEELGYVVRDLLEIGMHDLRREPWSEDNKRPGDAGMLGDNKRPGGNVPGLGPTAGRLRSRRDWVLEAHAQLDVPEPLASGPEVLAAPPEEEPDPRWRRVGMTLHKWARSNRAVLGLDESQSILVRGYHPVHRVAPSGELLLEMVVQFVQKRTLPGDLGGLTYLAGATLVAGIDGRVRYRIRKPFHESREDALRKWVDAFDLERGRGFGPPSPDRITEALSLRALHGGRR